MNIKLLGTGCPNCQKLEENVKKAIAELKMEASVEKITDIEEIVSYGAMSMPTLVIGEKIMTSGRIPDVEELKAIFSK
ncbi:MAG: thioredoxin family protein [Candidatus Moraniibacteriota bacterium]